MKRVETRRVVSFAHVRLDSKRRRPEESWSGFNSYRHEGKDDSCHYRELEGKTQRREKRRTNRTRSRSPPLLAPPLFLLLYNHLLLPQHTPPSQLNPFPLQHSSLYLLFIGKTHSPRASPSSHEVSSFLPRRCPRVEGSFRRVSGSEGS